MIYAIYINNQNEKILERFQDRTWELVKQIYPQILYATKEIDDPELLKHGIDTIVWERLFNPISKAKIRINVSYTPDNIQKMESEAEEKLKVKEEIVNQWENMMRQLRDEKYIKNLPRILESKRQHSEKVSENDKLFEGDLSDYQVLCKWKELDYIMPPPTKILRLKRDYQSKSWADFKEIVDRLCR